jgi:uncharacterized protein (TIGR03083 family)
VAPDDPAPSSQLLSQDPLVRADDYPPAAWVPIARLITARRRIQTMARQLPAAAWDAPSACPGWCRRDVLAHLVAWDDQHRRALDAVLADAPLDADSWRPDPAAPRLGRDVWNRREVDRRRDVAVADLAAAFDDGLRDLLDRLARCSAEQLLHSYGFAPNLLQGLDRHSDHVHAHADDIVNGPKMMR